VPDALRPVDAPTLRRMLRFGLETGGERLHLKPGCRPLVEGMGGARELNHRQLTVDDTRAMAGHLLEWLPVSERLNEHHGEGAEALYWYAEIPGEALIEVSTRTAPAGFALSLDIVRPLTDAEASALLEA